MNGVTDSSGKGIRNEYAKMGVEAYYKAKGHVYSNPHFAQIEALLVQNEHRIDYTNVLDFCCGSGEVSAVVRTLNYPLPIASDPFTQKAYQSNFNKKCLSLSFEDVIRGHLEGHYSAVICSFAMHLCPEKQLFPLVFNLFQHSSMLVIITPHKRPVLEEIDLVALVFEDFVLTERGKKVKLKAYEMIKQY